MGPGWLTSWDHLTGSRTSGSPAGCGPWIPSQGFGGLEEGEVGVSIAVSSTFLYSRRSCHVALLPGRQLSPGHPRHASSSASAAQVGEPLPSVGSGVGISISYYLEEATHTSK